MMKIALIHDHLAQHGGAEQVVRAFCDLWPDAPLYVIIHDPRNADPFFQTRKIHTSFIQRLPFGVRKYKWFFPLWPSAVEHFDLSSFDVVLSSSSSFAKGVITRPETLHITYCHTPTRFLWSDTHSYVAELATNRIVKNVLPLFLSHARIWDRIASERPDVMIANSQTVAGRIEKYYHRSSTVMYPPVPTAAFAHLPALKDPTKAPFLAGGRLVPYKRFDLLVEAFHKIGRQLWIFGDGPERARLQKMAGPHVRFLGRVSDEELRKLYAGCAAFLNPQEEDFGITTIEALAAGRPVIAYGRGGAVEIINQPELGVLVEYQTWEDIAHAVLEFDPAAYNPEVLRAKAKEFDLPHFQERVRTFVEEQWQAFEERRKLTMTPHIR